MHHNPNANRDLRLFAHELRTEGITGEALLWYYALKAKKMNGYQFHRRHPVGDTIVDFFCHKLNLIIEIEGNSHLLNSESDRKRQHDLERFGYQLLRFSEEEVLHRIDEVVWTISNTIETLEKNIKNQTS